MKTLNYKSLPLKVALSKGGGIVATRCSGIRNLITMKPGNNPQILVLGYTLY